jgi:hypothetical protein
MFMEENQKNQERVICPECGAHNLCPRCTDWICTVCGQDLLEDFKK